MSREILFRAKRKDNGEWVYGGSLLQLTPGDSCYIAPSSGMVLTAEDDAGNIIRLASNIAVVIPETVGQFTGLLDKNGTKIFEGDLVSTDIARPFCIVEFRDGCFMFNCNDGGENYYDIMLPITKEPHTAYKYGEVIGNIHDNPELLENEITI